MKTSFLIQLLLIVLLVVGGYVLFNKSISMRTKLIVGVFLVVIGIYLFKNLPFLMSYNSLIDEPKSAKETYTIGEEELKDSNGQFTISTWVYIDDWNYKYGEQKIILEKTIDNGTNVPKIYLDDYKNDLKIDLDVMSGDSNEFQNTMYKTLEDAGVTMTSISAESLECSGGFIFDSNNDIQYTNSCETTNVETTVIENIGLQKWVNVIMSVNARNMDVYINGKLVKTKAFDNVINTGLLNNGDIVVTPNGGFGGYVSNVQYYPYFITPKKAWSIYKDGFGSALTNALNRYNMSVTFYEDAVERKKYWVF